MAMNSGFSSALLTHCCGNYENHAYLIFIATSAELLTQTHLSLLLLYY